MSESKAGMIREIARLKSANAKLYAGIGAALREFERASADDELLDQDAVEVALVEAYGGWPL